MAAEDWDDCDQYEMDEEDNHYGIRCKYCGMTKLRWVNGDSGWRLYDGRVRHECAIRHAAAASEFPLVKSAKDSIDGTIYWMSPSGLQWKSVDKGITGNRPNMIIVDDPHAEMPEHQREVLARWFDKSERIGASTVKEKPKKKDYNTIGVRYAQGVGQVYTFKIRKGAKVHLGQELVDTRDGKYSTCFVVRIDKTPQDTEAHVQYRFLEHKVAPL
jgi:hypothetical protein